jgi:hypothetical protein
MFKSSKKRKLEEQKIQEQNEEHKKKSIEDFADIGDIIEYQGVKMQVISYHKWYCGFSYGLNVQWFNTIGDLKYHFFEYNMLRFIKNITKG